MKFKIYILIILTLTFKYNLIISQVPVTYTFDDATSLIIEGTSNVNSFDCKCKDKFPKNIIKVNFINNKSLKFSNGKLLMKSAKLDCNNSRMNKDLCNALKADQYPNIVIDLLEAKIETNNFDKNDEWSNIKATVNLNITNVTKQHQMDVKVKKISSNKIRLTCIHEILLTDFGIEPPTALFGLIKVNNKIKINFDIIANIED